MFDTTLSKLQSTLILAWVLLLVANPAEADEMGASAQDYFQELPVVLTASRLSQPLSEAPSAMTVIDRDMIKASGFRSVPELMRLVPGMYVGFADANRPVVSFNGSQDELARRMQILIDGRSIYLPPHGGVSWADLPLLVEDIERVEVVRGPSSASHGTNSFYGVINIITKEALGQEGSSVSIIRGPLVSDASARIGKVGEAYDFRISAGYRSDQGLDNHVLNDHNLTSVVNFRSNYHPNGIDNLDVQIGSSNGVYGLGILDVPMQSTQGFIGLSRPEDPFRDTKSSSDYLQLSWSHVWPSNDESKLTYSHAAHDYFDPNICVDKAKCQLRISPGGPLIVGGFSQASAKSQRDEVELQNTTQLGLTNRLVWGGGVRRDYAEYPLLLETAPIITPWQIFAHDGWRIGRSLLLNVGTMYENNGMGHQNNSPRASLNYHLTPEHTFRVGVSTATRSPVMTEAFISANNTIWGGGYAPPVNPLRPEKVLSKEVGYIGEFRSVALTVDVRAYLEQVSDLIWWDKFVKVTTDYYDSWGNILSTKYRGVDATLKHHWDDGHSFAVFSYTYQQAFASLGTLPTQYNSTVPELFGDFATIGDLTKVFYNEEYLKYFYQTVPKNSLSLLMSQRMGDAWQLSAGYYYRDMVRVADVSPPTIANHGVTPETVMRRLDMRLAKTIKYSHAQSAEFGVVVQNVLQDLYTKYGTIDPVSQVYFPRRAWLTATFNF